jgi:hypothetical protein
MILPRILTQINAMAKGSFILLLLWCLFGFSVQAQTDSTSIYKKIQTKAQKHKLTKIIYDAIFVDPDNVSLSDDDSDSIIVEQDNRKRKISNVFLPYANKPIRRVTIQVLDPFGFSVNDTNKVPEKRIQKLGNGAHITTRKIVIKNLLMFKEGDLLDPIALSESERILRNAPYVNDARIYVYTTSSSTPPAKGKKKKLHANDSIDLVIRVLDKWSLEPSSNYNFTSPDFTLTENNFAGIGHQVSQRVLYNDTRKMLGNAGRYGIYNIKNTYITAGASYYHDALLTSYSFVLDRPYYSPLAKWAGGAVFTKSYGHFLYVDSAHENKEYQMPLDFTLIDTWHGRNFRVGNKRKLKDKVSNIIAGVRYKQIIYHDRPAPEYDVNNELRDESLYLTNVGYSNTKFYKDRFISRFGANEDVPLGLLTQVIGGYRQRELESDMYYTGVNFSGSYLFKKIYLQSSLSFGWFYNKNSTNKGVAALELFGFSNLTQVGRWYFRQFVKFKYIQGINRSGEEYVSLLPTEMYGFRSDELRANAKAFVNLQTVMFTPYNIIGFRFAPVLMFGFGQVGYSVTDVFRSKIYHAYSLGLMVRNENLLFNTFEINISIYPNVPVNGFEMGGGFSSLRKAPFSIYSVGKPDVLPYY